MTGGGDDNGGKKNGDASGTKTSSSYFLSSNDNLRNLITHVQLIWENCEEWSRAIRTALQAKKKLVFIDRTMKKPDDESPDLEDWWTVNSMLVAWMFNTIEPTLRCECDLTIKLQKKREEEKVHQFLVGLNVKAYGTLHLNVLSTEPLPPLNMVYAMTIQEERVQEATQLKDERDSVSFAVHANLGKQTTTVFEAKDRTITCSECNRTGHTSESCFEIIGYLEWWGDRPKKTGREAGKGRGGSKSYGNRGRGGNMGARANVAQVPHVGVTQETNVDRLELEH
ncbi:retrovirus-related pol polyprotein from transposon TNT 1-94 [Tanacetum coccineum]